MGKWILLTKAYLPQSDEIADPADTLNEHLRDTSREPSSVMPRFLTHRSKLINVFCFKLHICGKFIAQQYTTNTSLFYSVKEEKNKIYLDRNRATSPRTQNSYGPNTSSTSSSSSEHCLNVPTTWTAGWSEQGPQFCPQFGINVSLINIDVAIEGLQGHSLKGIYWDF